MRALDLPAAFVALADAVAQRLHSGRLLAEDQVDYGLVLALIQQIVSLRDGITAAHVRQWAKDELMVDVAAGGASADAEAGENSSVLTWGALATAIYATAEDRRAHGHGVRPRYALLAAWSHSPPQVAAGGQSDRGPWYIMSSHSFFYRSLHILFLVCTIWDFVMVPIEFAFLELGHADMTIYNKDSELAEERHLQAECVLLHDVTAGDASPMAHSPCSPLPAAHMCPADGCL